MGKVYNKPTMMKDASLFLFPSSLGHSQMQIAALITEI